MSEAPDWFWEAVETESTSGFVEVEDIDINYLSWSKPAQSGLLFVHGHNAHAHWWDFIAPSFMDDHQTVALDLSGMGDSDHRDAYSNDTYAEEILAAADENQMPQETVLVAHSFGGMMALRVVSKYPDRFKGLVLLDSGVRHPEDVEERGPQVERWTKPKIYPSREIALARFRLQPPQQCENQYIVDHIARHSVEFDDAEDGWVWKFDDELKSRMSVNGNLEEDYRSISIPMALIYGAQSESFSAKSAAYMKELKPDLQVVEMAEAQHHLFLDQPLAFMDHLKQILSGW